MPYIKKEDRAKYDAYLAPLSDEIKVAGDLNYVISTLCDYYLTDHGKNYANVNLLVGALECAKLEMYRRIAAPYEDGKIGANGEVYTNASHK